MYVNNLLVTDMLKKGSEVNKESSLTEAEINLIR